MAERRMFTKKITDDDNFASLSASAQALYLHLSMSADDDGFCNQVSICMFKAHASLQDLEALLAKRYLYQFDTGVIVIKHWRMANALRKDRYTPTAFQEELAQLRLKDNGSYTLSDAGKPVVAEWLPDGSQVDADCLPQDSIGKVSIDKGSIEEDRENNNLYTHDEYINDDPVKTWGDRILFNIDKGLGVDGLVSLAELRGVTREQLRKYVGDKKKEGKKT